MGYEFKSIRRIILSGSGIKKYKRAMKKEVKKEQVLIVKNSLNLVTKMPFWRRFRLAWNVIWAIEVKEDKK